jgi:hypothetical protein
MNNVNSEHHLALELLRCFKQFQLSEFRIRKWDAERFKLACACFKFGWIRAAMVCTGSIGSEDVVPELLELEFADEERLLLALRLVL